MDQNRLGVVEITVLGDCDLASKNNHEAGSNLPARHQRLMGRK
jgi:hypothetical protein